MTSQVMVGARRLRYPLSMRNFGPLLREWRRRRRLSQAALADAAEVSTRHLSCLETGRSAPSRTMVLVLGSALEMPLRERNLLLAAAGFSAAYRSRDLDDPEMRPVRDALRRILDAVQPAPSIVVDRDWRVRMQNAPAERLMAYFLVPDPALLPHMDNPLQLLFHPRGLRQFIVNWPDVARATLAHLRQDALLDPGDGGPADMLAALTGWLDPSILSAAPRAVDAVLIPVHLRRDDVELRLFTAVTSLSTPMDVTAQELRIETYFPADDATTAWLAG